jgi:hypothetical protein
MPIQIKMNTNLSNSSHSHSHSRSTVQNQGLGSSVGVSLKSNNTFQNSMIGRVHLSKPGCSSCGH